MNSGLIEQAGHESELAGVMAHETAHIVARYGTRSAWRAEVANVTHAILAGLAGQKADLVHAVASVATLMTFLKCSRTFEKQADFLGVKYLYATGCDPLGLAQFFERLFSLQARNHCALPAVFSSHPPTAKRVRLVPKTTNKLLPDKPAHEVTGSEFDTVKARLGALRSEAWLAAARRAGVVTFGLGRGGQSSPRSSLSRPRPRPYPFRSRE